MTGLGIICSGGRNPKEFWARLLTGQTAITAILDPAYAVFESAYAGQIPGEWLLDQLSGADLELDKDSQMGLVAARQAIAHGSLDLTEADAGRFGVVLGRCVAARNLKQRDASGGWKYQPMHASLDIIAGRVAAYGPRILVSTACAAGGNAVGMARDRILAGEADVMLAGGLDPLLFDVTAGFNGLQALSPGPTRPYSRSDGLSLGEGAAFLLVESRRHAEARGATLLAEVAGYGLSADAHHPTAPDPTGRGGASAVRRALAEAGLGVEDVDYVSGHGTGTPANDAMERKVMRTVFGDRAATVPMSSIKSFVGHTLGASGAIEALAGVIALNEDTAPPTAGFDQADIEVADLDFVPNEPRAMPIDVVVSNNYAFGGNNVSVVLRKPGGPERPVHPPREAVISGLGPVSALGVGVARWRAALAEGRSGVSRRGTGMRAEAAPLERPYAPRNVWRHMNHLSKLSTAATRLAWEDAGLALRRAQMDEVGLIFATAGGSMESVQSFDQSVTSDPRHASVMDFSSVVLNATGGAVCQALGLRGETTTICHGGVSASLALDCALDLIRARKAEVVVVLAADDLNEPMLGSLLGGGRLSAKGAALPYDRRRDGAVPGTAAVALVVESAEHCAARGGVPYARVISTMHASRGGDGECDAVRRSLAAAASGGHRPELVVGMADGSPEDAAEAEALAACLPSALVTAPAALTGGCQAASGAMNLAVAALAVREGVVPPVAGLAEPEVGDLARYVTRPGSATRVDAAVALTAAIGSVRGAVLLGRLG
ncbi:beta-ketoacyl-[acyl-carrier-protein] synthase family protein [Nonomuraea cypriaca]|uniref:beta-ketoacyl-[acyl-carrier-protein] synthase family protein n=1 Tax=Nonomuraea cypriaca TaxID=1187855 RepID=UPI002E2A09E0|nr:beta-ketoacyl-[acyl-carrier-protein] synthase family protein [Nonomuraea cypriaca]